MRRLARWPLALLLHVEGGRRLVRWPDVHRPVPPSVGDRAGGLGDGRNLDAGPALRFGPRGVADRAAGRGGPSTGANALRTGFHPRRVVRGRAPPWLDGDARDPTTG